MICKITLKHFTTYLMKVIIYIVKTKKVYTHFIHVNKNTNNQINNRMLFT